MWARCRSRRLARLLSARTPRPAQRPRSGSRRRACSERMARRSREAHVVLHELPVLGHVVEVEREPDERDAVDPEDGRGRVAGMHASGWKRLGHAAGVLPGVFHRVRVGLGLRHEGDLGAHEDHDGEGSLGAGGHPHDAGADDTDGPRRRVRARRRAELGAGGIGVGRRRGVKAHEGVVAELDQELVAVAQLRRAHVGRDEQRREERDDDRQRAGQEANRSAHDGESTPFARGPGSPASSITPTAASPRGFRRRGCPSCSRTPVMWAT